MNELHGPIENEDTDSCISLQDGIIYGPVFSRRLGRSLGINLLSNKCKICSFNCIYCEYGLTGCYTSVPPEKVIPSVDEVLFAVEKALRKPRSIDCITFSGNGEPTLHPDFLQILQGIKRLRDDLRPVTKLAVLSNGSQLQDPNIFSAMRVVDLPMIKLDGGNAETVEKVNRPVSSISFKDIFDGLNALPRKIIQTMLLDGVVSTIHGENYLALAETLKALSPEVVHIYTIERPPAMRGVKPVAHKTLAAIQKDLSARFHLKVRAF